MFFLFKRNRRLVLEIQKYLEISESVMISFGEAMQVVMDKGPGCEFEVAMEKNGMLEHNADDLLHDIEKALYKKSLMPESREDILILLERLDDIIDQASIALKHIYNHNLTIPELIRGEVSEMVQISIDTHKAVGLGVIALFDRISDIKEHVTTINNNESICDRLSGSMVRKLFTSDIPDFDKIISRDMVEELANISDLCEDAADSLVIMDIKRII